MSAAIKPILAILLLFAVGSLAFGQAGSTGGTIGNTNKSVSGEEGAAGPDAAARPHPKSERPIEKRNRTNVPPPGGSATESSLCEAVVGNWTFSNRIGVVFNAGGDLSATNGDAGKWTCKSGMVTARWRKWTDHYVVSSDRAHMSGNSGLLNFALSATKN